MNLRKIIDGTLHHQKCLLPYLYFRFACRSNNISELFPFKYPIISDTLNLGYSYGFASFALICSLDRLTYCISDSVQALRTNIQIGDLGLALLDHAGN